MTTNGIVRQCRRIRSLRLDLTVRHKPQFDQRLESVADAQTETVSFV